MDRSRRCAAINDLAAVGAQVIRRDFCQQPVLPDWQKLSFEDRTPHRAGAVGHRRLHQPALSKLTEALGLLDPAFVALFFLGRRPAFEDCTFSVDRRFTGSSKGQRSEEHTSELQSLMRISYAV